MEEPRGSSGWPRSPTTTQGQGKGHYEDRPRRYGLWEGVGLRIGVRCTEFQDLGEDVASRGQDGEAEDQGAKMPTSWKRILCGAGGAEGTVNGFKTEVM